jgi:protein-arginine kinase activator protein McsA
VTGDGPVCQLCQAKRATVSFSCWRSGHFLDRTFVCLDCAPTYERLSCEGPGRLAKFVANAAIVRAKAVGIDPEKGCPGCGKTIAMILTDGIAGCEVCYMHFSKDLAGPISSVQPWGAHVGKSPFGG